MAEQAEQAFIKAFLNTLSSQPIIYPDDYQQPPEDSLKKVPILPVEIPPPPEREQPTSSVTPSATISVTFKSSKPPASYTLTVQPTDTISSIKAQLAAQSTAPPADSQRLLLKGKALVDNKLLKEYTIKDGDTINLMVKPGVDWDPTKPTVKKAMPENKLSLSLDPTPKPTGHRHQRIPSVVLSPSPSSETPGQQEKDILLTLDAGASSSPVPTETLTSYHETVAKPEFWERLRVFLQSEFSTEADALIAFEDFLRASKGSLTASEIAKIRDQVGVIGMAGT
ncbi:hypothetical protein AX16_004404 [Volvariella volvacea WC 439]|nr:hypothetical protein AX16_004404 [Volvariella volvacea WC 439]